MSARASGDVVLEEEVEDASVSEKERVVAWREESREVWGLAWPVILTFALQMSADLLTLSAVGNAPHPNASEMLAAAALGQMFVNATAQALVQGLATAVDTLCSQAFGALNLLRIGVVTQRAVAVLFAFCLLFLPVWLFAGDILGNLGQDPEASVLAGKYVTARIPGVFASAIFEVAKKFLQTQTLTRPGMLAAALGATCQGGGAWIAIHALDFGVEGVAWVASISQTIAAASLVAYCVWLESNRATLTVLQAEEEEEEGEVGGEVGGGEERGGEEKVDEERGRSGGEGYAVSTSAGEESEEEEEKGGVGDGDGKDGGSGGAGVIAGRGEGRGEEEGEEGEEEGEEEGLRGGGGGGRKSGGKSDGRKKSGGRKSGGSGSSGGKVVVDVIRFPRDPEEAMAMLHKNPCRFPPTWPGLRLEHVFQDWGEFLQLGVPGWAMVALEWGSFEVQSLLAGRISTITLDAHTVLALSGGAGFMAPLGLSVAAAVRVGVHLGESRPSSARRSTTLVCVLALLWSVIFAIFAFVGAEAWARIFSSDQEVVSLAAKTMPIMALFGLFDHQQGTLAGVARGAGLQTQGALVNLVSYWFIATAVSFGVSQDDTGQMGLPGIWLSLSLGALCASIALATLLYRVDWAKLSVIARKRALQPVEETDNTESNNTTQTTSTSTTSSTSSTSTRSSSTQDEERGTSIELVRKGRKWDTDEWD